MRIGLYGGSFDPVHYGHLNVARTALRELDRLLILPAAVSPFKTSAAPVSATYDRLKMIHDAFDTLPNTVVDERELRRGGVSYAIDTVREIAAEHPGDELFFLIGEDSVDGLSRWKNIDALRQLCTFKIFPRTTENSTAIREAFTAAHVALNPDEKVVGVVQQGLTRKGGFCPCRLPKVPEFFCPCEEFRHQLADPAYHGLCHCRLYLKP